MTAHGSETGFDQLLGNGAGAFFDLAILEIYEGSADDAFRIKSVMAVKTAVFDCDNRLLHRIRDIANRYIAVRIDSTADGPAKKEKTSDTIGKRELHRAAFLPESRRLAFWCRQEVACMLPGSRRKDGSSSGAEKCGKEDQNKKE